MKRDIKNSIKMIGDVKVTLSKGNLKFEECIEAKQSMGGDILPLIRMHNEKNKIREFTHKNIVTTSFHNMIADYISTVVPANDIVINYGALGIGTDTPLVGDTTLGTESYRKQISSLSSSGNIVYVTVFYSSTEVDGTFYEHSFFSDGTATPDSGIMVNKVLIDAPTGLAKSNTETLTIDYALTIQ